MKTDTGWTRGTLCGKQFEPLAAPLYACDICGRPGAVPRDLCYPVKLR